MNLAGVDLAWTDKHPTGIAVDAPLIIKNDSGMRECERLIGQEYGARKASCMPSNLNKYPDHPAVELSARLERAGFSHLQLSGKWQIECYPHPAIINIFGLHERLKYKKKKGMRVADQIYGQHRLGCLLRSLSNSPVIKLNISNYVQAQYFKFDREDSLSGKALKSHEDKLDAIVCLYVAALHATQQTDVHGSIYDGYIVVPKQKNYVASPGKTQEWEMASWAVETAYNYCRVAAETWNTDGLVSMTNAALAVEIILKSYLLEPVANVGKLNERYELKPELKSRVGDGHDLSKLFDALPQPIQRKLESPFVREMLYKYRNFFKESRYAYEPKASANCNKTLQSIAESMIRTTVEIYRQRGSEDPFIVAFGNSKS